MLDKNKFQDGKKDQKKNYLVGFCIENECSRLLFEKAVVEVLLLLLALVSDDGLLSFLDESFDIEDRFPLLCALYQR